jgi:LmbE family N-acetylglucosaminyl deacetylase
MKHVYLAPHADDAVLACGGTIHRQASAGEPVLVLTFFVGAVQAGAALSPFARQQHSYWGDPPQPMALRRAEDRAALTLLGAETLHWDYFDAVYRTDAGGQPVYPDLDSLWGAVHPGDPMALDESVALTRRLAGLFSGDDPVTIYAPLGVGHHVDHQIVHTAAWGLLRQDHRLAFYEDYPYAEKAGAVEAALALAGAGSGPSPGGRGWRVEHRPLDAADVAARVAALSYYRTQLGVLFGSVEAMTRRVWTFAATCSAEHCLAERIWWPDSELSNERLRSG